MERTLNELGVSTFKQLADFQQVDIDKVSKAIGSFPGRIERDDWVGKAKQILQEQDVVWRVKSLNKALRWGWIVYQDTLQ